MSALNKKVKKGAAAVDQEQPFVSVFSKSHEKNDKLTKNASVEVDNSRKQASQLSNGKTQASKKKERSGSEYENINLKV